MLRDDALADVSILPSLELMVGLGQVANGLTQAFTLFHVVDVYEAEGVDAVHILAGMAIEIAPSNGE